jgi:hypothetical protein
MRTVIIVLRPSIETRLPIKLDTTSNGEFEPVPLSRANCEANHRAREDVTRNAKRLNLSKRQFLISACGTASTLLAFNAANAAAGKKGGFFDLSSEAALDQQLAQARVGSKGEFIFDVQGHFVDPTGAWVKNASPSAFKWSPKAGCGLAQRPGPMSHLACLGPEEFVKDVFLDSDTDMMVLSFVPSTREAEPLTIQAADAVRRVVDRLQGTHRLMLHGRVNPNQAGDLEAMDELKARWGVCAWKTYTQFGPGGRGYFLTDDVGLRFIEKARGLDVKVICIHKGLPFGKQSYEHSQCSDIGAAARRFPDVKFLVYHSGFVSTVREQPYDHGARRHRHADPFARREWRETRLERLCRAGEHLALSHARPGAGGACARETVEVLRRGQRPVGNGFHLVRFAAGPDPGLPRLPDRGRAARGARLSGDYPCDPGEDLRAERGDGLRFERGGSEEVREPR